MAAQKHTSVDLTYPSTSISRGSTLGSSHVQLCPIHEKAKTGIVVKKQPNKQAKKVGFLQKLWGNNSLERKLESHGIKMKVKYKRRNKIEPKDEQTGY